MGRHGKNQTASAVYSYHEKKKDSESSGYGSKAVRLGKDSLQEFDCCSLSLQPCTHPVITSDGHLYEKEAILECLIHQKRENARKMKEYEKQCQKQQSELEELATAEARDKIEKFIGVSCTTSDAVKQDKPKLPSFWIPSLTPTHSSNTIKKPTNKTLCPMSGKPLRVKDLINVNFTPLDSRGVVSKTSRSRYMCPVTHDTLNNSTPCAVLKLSGHVVTMKCVKDIIKPSMVCPLTGGKLNESDIIPIIRGGTGYSGIGVSLEANKQGAALMA